MSCVSLPDMLFLGPRSSRRVICHGFTWSNVAHSSVCPSDRRWSSPLVVASRSCKRASTAKTYHGKMSEKSTVPTPKVMIDSILRGTLDCKPCLKHTKTIRTTRAWRASTTSCGKVPSWCIYFLYAFGRGRGDKTYFAPPLNLVWKGARGKDPTYSSSLMQLHPIFSQVLPMLLHKVVGHRHFLNQRQCFMQAIQHPNHVAQTLRTTTYPKWGRNHCCRLKLSLVAQQWKQIIKINFEQSTAAPSGFQFPVQQWQLSKHFEPPRDTDRW